ncbi:MAG: hypothetical protein ACFB9N_13200 [Geitlerinemataceae cyanobacterium]
MLLAYPPIRFPHPALTLTHFLHAEPSLPQIAQEILGCPVTRRIVDRRGRVLLEVGSLIDYETIERAEREGFLDAVIEAAYR